MLGFLLSIKGIKPKTKKIQALLDMTPLWLERKFSASLKGWSLLRA